MVAIMVGEQEDRDDTLKHTHVGSIQRLVSLSPASAPERVTAIAHISVSSRKAAATVAFSGKEQVHRRSNSPSSDIDKAIIREGELSSSPTEDEASNLIGPLELQVQDQNSFILENCLQFRSTGNTLVSQDEEMDGRPVWDG
jgi:hypothetical protein